MFVLLVETSFTIAMPSLSSSLLLLLLLLLFCPCCIMDFFCSVCVGPISVVGENVKCENGSGQ